MGRIRRVVSSASNGLLARWDVELRSRPPDPLNLLLDRLRREVRDIGAVLDVGAAFGDWSRACSRYFPHSWYVLIEPVPAYEPFLRALQADLQHVEVIRAVATSGTGTRHINVHPDLVGSSLLREVEGPGVDGTPLEVDAVTLDQTMTRLRPRGQLIIKIDVQGAELEVIAGAAAALRRCALIVLEASLFDFFEGGARVDEVISAMGNSGFVLHDVFDLKRRPLDGALAQLDLAFVPRESPLRKDHRFATAAQRAQQNEAFSEDLQRRIRDLETRASRHSDV